MGRGGCVGWVGTVGMGRGGCVGMGRYRRDG